MTLFYEQLKNFQSLFSAEYLWPATTEKLIKHSLEDFNPNREHTFYIWDRRSKRLKLSNFSLMLDQKILDLFFIWFYLPKS